MQTIMFYLNETEKHLCIENYIITIMWTFQVVQGLDSATFCIDDIDEWLQIINVKLRHMREDIASVCSCSVTKNFMLVLT